MRWMESVLGWALRLVVSWLGAGAPRRREPVPQGPTGDAPPTVDAPGAAAGPQDGFWDAPSASAAPLLVRSRFYDRLRADGLLGSRLTTGQVTGIEAVLDAWERWGNPGQWRQLAYVLATVLAEVGRGMVPVREGFKATDEEARAHVRRQGYRYAAPAGPHGHVYYGRGFVQLTWLENYRAAEARLGVPLVAEPDRALEPALAGRLLVEGMLKGHYNRLGHGLGYYLSEDHADWVEARRTVNVLDRAGEIAGWAQRFDAVIRGALGQGERG